MGANQKQRRSEALRTRKRPCHNPERAERNVGDLLRNQTEMRNKIVTVPRTCDARFHLLCAPTSTRAPAAMRVSWRGGGRAARHA